MHSDQSLAKLLQGEVSGSIGYPPKTGKSTAETAPKIMTKSMCKMASEMLGTKCHSSKAGIEQTTIRVPKFRKPSKGAPSGPKHKQARNRRPNDGPEKWPKKVPQNHPQKRRLKSSSNHPRNHPRNGQKIDRESTTKRESLSLPYGKSGPRILWLGAHPGMPCLRLPACWTRPLLEIAHKGAQNRLQGESRHRGEGADKLRNSLKERAVRVT